MVEKEQNMNFALKLITALFILIGMFTASMVFGAADISLEELSKALFTRQVTDKILIIREIRLPREIAAIFVGSALAVSGAIMQGITKNPLADPGLLGLSAGANAALAFTIAFVPRANYFVILIACIIGAAMGVFMVFGISFMKRGGFSAFRIVLAGSAVSTFLFAVAQGIGIYFKISKDVSMWTSGAMIGTTWTQLKVIIPFITAGIVTAMFLARQLTILSLSEEVALGLGQNTTKVKMILFVVIVLLAGSSVALVGNMAFVGLMVPHMVRFIVGSDYRYIIPMSAVDGAILMLFADTLGRTINAPYETSVSAIIAIIGLPFFLFIVNKGGKAFS